MIRVCLFGVGRMGQVHAQTIAHSQHGLLHSIVDPNMEVAKEIAEKYGAKYIPNQDNALSDPEVDAVVIASNTDTHADLISAAARAKKPVFCEKPIDLNLDRIDSCLNVVNTYKVPLMLGFQRRFDPHLTKLKQQVDEGCIGHVEQLIISCRDSFLPSRDFLASSGGIFRDMMIHDFDLARWILGDEPKEIYATGSCLVDSTLHEIGDIDSAMVILKTKNGALCHVNNCRRSIYGYDQRLEAFGEKGMLRMHNPSPTVIEYTSETGVQNEKPHPYFPQRYATAYQIEIEHFLNVVVKENKTPLITGEDGRKAILIAEAAQQSFETNQVVKIGL